jgi:hypothetical protein
LHLHLHLHLLLVLHLLLIFFLPFSAPIKIDGRTQTEVDAGQKALVTGMASMIGGGSIGKLSKDIITNPIVKRAIAQ